MEACTTFTATTITSATTISAMSKTETEAASGPESEVDDVLSMVTEVKARLKSVDDLDLVRELKGTKKAIEESRRADMEAARAERDALQREVDLIKANSARGISDWRTPEAHAQEIDRLHTDKFAMAKANADLQAQIERLEQNKDAMEAQIEGLDQQDPAEGVELDPNAITLKILRQMGFRPLYKSDGSTFEELTLSSSTRDSSVLVNVSPEHMRREDISPLAMADQLWKAVE